MSTSFDLDWEGGGTLNRNIRNRGGHMGFGLAGLSLRCQGRVWVLLAVAGWQTLRMQITNWGREVVVTKRCRNAMYYLSM